MYKIETEYDREVECTYSVIRMTMSDTVIAFPQGILKPEQFGVLLGGYEPLAACEPEDGVLREHWLNMCGRTVLLTTYTHSPYGRIFFGEMIGDADEA